MEIIKPGIERLGEGDYPAFLTELETHTILSGRAIDTATIPPILELLNRSYDLHGEVSVSSDRATEVVTISPDYLALQPRRPNWDEPESFTHAKQRIFVIEGFRHLGFGLGFGYDTVNQEFVLTITDDANPLRAIRANGIEAPFHRMFYVPVMQRHSISVINGFKLEFAPA